MSARLHDWGALRAELIATLIAVTALPGCGGNGNGGEDGSPVLRA